MAKNLHILLLLVSFSLYAQKKEIRRITTNVNTIEINTDGLDNLLLMNSNSDKVEVILNAQDYDNQFINVSNKID